MTHQLKEAKAALLDKLSRLSARAEPIVFFGGNDYLPLFFSPLTAPVKSPRTVFFNSIEVPQAPGCVLRRFETRTKRNWHYESANAFIDGEIQADDGG